MENAKIVLENGSEANVNGLFYVFNSKYYFIYTQGELVDNDYIHLYLVQVCKEIQNTPNGQVDTGNMLGMEIADQSEWGKVQTSITKIVDDKKNGTTNSDIQYLPMTMLTNLKIVSKNKFKLMKHIVEENFKVQLTNQEQPTPEPVEVVAPVQPISPQLTPEQIQPATPAQPIPLQSISQQVQPATLVVEQPVVPIQPVAPVQPETQINQTSVVDALSGENDVIIDYRSKFFEEQEKNKELEEQIKILQGKLDSIKGVLE